MTGLPPPTQRVSAPRRRTRLMGWLLVGLLVIGFAVTVTVAGMRMHRLTTAYEAEVGVWLSEQERAFVAVPLLTEREERLLRRSLNRAHVAAAQEFGAAAPPSTRPVLDSLVEAGGGLDIDAPNGFYVALRATYSREALVPSAALLLDVLGTRFQLRLDSAGLPHYQYLITSAWRSSDDQAALRGVNVNAASGNSSHEYGTTFDIPYQRYFFAGGFGLLDPPPVPEALPRWRQPQVRARAYQRIHATMATWADRYPSRLDAILGRTLIDMEDDGLLLVVRERGQPVYHVTVARDLAAEQHPSAATPSVDPE